MSIEQPSDRNMTRTDHKHPTVSDMIDLQKALVADRIAGLQHEAAALRAERTRNRSAAPAPVSTVPVPLPVVTSGSPRVRLGRWLVAIGTSIAGASQPTARAMSVSRLSGWLSGSSASERR